MLIQTYCPNREVTREHPKPVKNVFGIHRLVSTLQVFRPTCRLHGTLSVSFMPLTFQQVLLFLYMLVAVMLIIVLYHVIFIVVDARKISKRVEIVTREIQEVILKPLSAVDQVMDFVMDFIHQKSKDKKKHRSVDAD